jgi:ABC-type phosphate transport system, periplasmic component
MAGYFFIRMKKLLLLPLIFGGVVWLTSCNRGEQSRREQTIVSGTVAVMADETLMPVMEEEVAVFEHLYDRTDVNLSFGHENQIVGKLLNREVEVVVLTRPLTEKEHKFFEARQFEPRVYRFATDAVALVVSRETADSTIAVDDMEQALKGGKLPEPFSRLVFDNANSSTIRFLREIAGVDSLPTEGVYALKSNLDVLRYVSETPNTIGVVGLSWLARPDGETREFIAGLKVMAVRGKAGGPAGSGYFKPTQSNLADSLYALSRPVYIVNAEPKKSLGMGFAAFLTGESGQRVILKAGLLPDSLPPREIIIR